MDDKRRKILTDECNMTDAIPGEMQTGSVFAVEYAKYVQELNSEFQLWKNQADRGQLTLEDINLICRDTLLKNVQMRRSSWLWFLSSKTKKEMTKNRLRNIFLTMLEKHIQGSSEATFSVETWLGNV